ncbi:DUF4097 family beta strand repeat-containing protein [Streptomyces longispororuber]|uniref:DUF4097 family beta strand repeat-containing protein n=1 Tax=Streptomyces longispororuber TaxID=68230 RepID=UPI00210BF1AB|nr:DUF4097 family beta strand repeat-containing protein [Streptomyces longispororuber]MCQ4213854.1 DUF4097 domain-containing protein [Streptomyces longispororuber]
MRARSPRTVRALAAATAVVAVAATATACGADSSDDTSPEHRSFALHGKTLTVDSDDSRLDLVPGDGKEVKVTRWFEGSTVIGSSPEATWSWRSAEDRLTLRMHCSGFIVNCSARHRVEVPRGVAVVVRNDDGSVHARDFRNGLDISTSDGSVRVENSSGPLRLNGEDGSLHATGIDARRVTVRTEDGEARIDLRTVPDRVEATSQDGSLTLGLPGSARYRVTTDTDDGAVDVSVPRDPRSEHRVSARAQDGKVTVRTAN